MEREEIRRLLYEKYIRPTEQKKELYAGVEIEIPAVNLSGGATDQDVTKQAFGDFTRAFGFQEQGRDQSGICYSATDPVTGDNISFDCSYNNLEFSFAASKSLRPLAERFRTYITFLNDHLASDDHLLTGMGINPHYHANRKDYLPVPRYQMLEGY